MSVYQRGGVYWYKFRFQGLVVRESTKTASRSLAEKAERKRHAALPAVGGGDASGRAIDRIKKPDRKMIMQITAAEPHRAGIHARSSPVTTVPEGARKEITEIP